MLLTELPTLAILQLFQIMVKVLMTLFKHESG